MDNLTGQNNSLVSGFDGLAANAKDAPGVRMETVPVGIVTVKIETYCEQMAFLPDFIKIDVEGHELAVLNGAKKLIGSNVPPVLMVEIQADHHEVLQTLRDYGCKFTSLMVR